MIKHRKITYFIIVMLCLSMAGCAGLQRKFTRKKKLEQKPVPVITTHDYAKDLRVEELYKKHFLYWKTWQGELIDRMDAGYKKRVECYDHTLMHLEEMAKYLAESKSKELGSFIGEIKSIDPDIRKKRLSKSEENNMRSLLEKTKRRIDKEFSYSNVKDSLELKK